MNFLDLPSDIINSLPIYLHSVTDLYALLSTCRALYIAYGSSKVRLPPVLPRLFGQPLLPPHPHLLLAGTVRQVADWAVLSIANRARLHTSLLEGNDGLLKLSEQVACMSLKDMRDLHDLKYSLLNPLTRTVDIEAGPQMVRDNGYDPDNYSWTIVCDPDVALLNYWIYCELFHHNVNEILNHSTRTSLLPKPLDLKTRRRWIAYCVPDANNHRNRAWKEIGDFEQLSQTKMWSCCDTFTRREMALFRFFESGELKEYGADKKVRGRSYPWDYDPGVAEQRVNICIDAAIHLGAESLKMLLPGGLYQARARLEEIKQRVDAIAAVDVRRSRGVDRPWTGISIAGDCHEGISTNMMSEEELAEELAEDEAEGFSMS